MSTDGVQQASEPLAGVSTDSDTNSNSQPAVSNQTEPVVPGIVASQPLPSEPLVTDQVASTIQQPVPTGLGQIDQADLTASTLRHSRGVGCVLESHDFEPFQHGTMHRPKVSRPKSTVSGLRTRYIKKSEASNARHDLLDGQVQPSSNTVSSCFTSIQFCKAKPQILES
ncbi:hypothetical protein V6N11_061708 [Hibiscus sabdariffa]|uniref:Uncharacterized protein n=1 Tax=Hibiscus sabdariffa TaxID=183260 RepID=A0ABR2NUS5_9ROSI